MNSSHTSRPQFLRLAAIMACFHLLKWMCNFENLADLKFFARSVPGASLPFDIYHQLGYGAPDNYLELPCEALSTDVIYTSQQPLLFKGCTRNQSTIEEMVPFPESVSDILPDCDYHNRPFNLFDYEDLQGNQQHIVEFDACGHVPLSTKVQRFLDHDLERDGSFADVHTAMLDYDMEKVLSDHLIDGGFVANKDYQVGGNKWGVTSVLAHFFTAGGTVVDYYHSHQERALSFGMGKTKVWELINPRYHNRFNYEWSGYANVLTKELEEAPTVVIPQEPGDIMLLPPWWIHRTQHDDNNNDLDQQAITKSFSFNIHMMTPRSVMGVSCYVFMKVLGLPQWLYGQDTVRGVADV